MAHYDNHAVAAALDSMGALLEIQDAGKFRVLAYKKASQALRACPEDIDVLAREGRITDIPGIGKSIAISIGQMLETGTFPELESAKSRFPTSLVEVMQVPGVGPKKARLLYERLGVDSVQALENPRVQEEMAALPGFGPRSVENIRAGLESFHRTHERVLLSEAVPVAEGLAGILRELPFVEHAEPVGSVRRRRETIADVDVLVASLEPGRVMEEVRGMDMVARVLGSGPGKTSVLTMTGVRADVRVVAPEQWGAAMQRFTGSQRHNERVREIAVAAGLEVDEYGVFRIEGGERLRAATEDEVYSQLGMDCPAPELREDAGEIEAALEHRLPRLVELSDIRGDMHLHTSATDGRSTVAQNRAKAAELGYEYLVVSDHAYELRMVGGLDLDQLERQWAIIDELNADPAGPRVLKGIELNIDDEGGVDYPPEVLARFDVCLASLHSGWKQDRTTATRRLLRAMENPRIDVISHHTGRLLGKRDPIDLDMEAVLAKAAETGTIMEVNSFPDRLDLCDLHLRIAKRHGVRIAISTDSHAVEQMGYMGFGVSTARRGWITREEVLNAQPLDVMLSWLKRSQA